MYLTAHKNAFSLVSTDVKPLKGFYQKMWVHGSPVGRAIKLADAEAKLNYCLNMDAVYYA
jgi:hypothetical protein